MIFLRISIQLRKKIESVQVFQYLIREKYIIKHIGIFFYFETLEIKLLLYYDYVL